jgi:hypothetical protein
VRAWKAAQRMTAKDARVAEEVETMATHTSTPRKTAAGASVSPRASARTALPGLASAMAVCPPRYLAVSLGQPQLPGSVAQSAEQAHRASRGTGVRRRFGELRTALADGWEIVQPIFARPLWSVADDSITAFNFVLRRGSATRLLTVPQGRTVERFMRDQHLLVDYQR